MIIGDSVHTMHVILGQVLNVPFIIKESFNPTPSRHDRLAHNAGSPSYVPERRSYLSDSMTFRERLKNMVLHWFRKYFDYKIFTEPVDLHVLKKHNIRPGANILQLISEAEMWICGSELVMDIVRPLSPHVKTVGSFLTGPANPLNEVT